MTQTVKISTGRGSELVLTDDVTEALADVLQGNGCMVLLDFNDAGAFRVRISYGDPVRDAAVNELFDEAEWGCDKNFDKALRFALGQHYGSMDDESISPRDENPSYGPGNPDWERDRQVEEDRA